ncbi:integrator complex subunit 6-like [Anopheles bellator]|uniref:integrator complex subunit 6-like n=1 Tax=Anopheles bellator TaxID=139047 RepID=UPI002648F454|nr:integrator complex subunit 6-like [Anopheles bellator]
MTIILFLVDTSASMCQKALVNGVQKSYLDISKGAVETFLKFRQRSQDCMGDRYMLLTFEDPPNNVKAGWKENHATFMNELKNLQSNGLTSMGEALKNAFDLLNLNRMQSGIDTYGQGRCPFYLEPSVIIVLTDGGKYAFRNGVHQEIILPLHAQMPGTKLTKEPFRWDQRLFSLVLRIPGNRVDERSDSKVPHDDSMIEKMCEVTGGRSYKIKSHYVLNQCIESLVQKVQPGVVIHFDQLITNNGDTSTIDIQFQSTKRMIYVPKQHPSQKTFPVGYWPIPEPYWPDPKLTNLPPRDAHPKIKVISPCCDEPQVLRNFPIDKYELEASPLTLQILSKKEMNKVWPLIVSTGMQGEMPFGYLKPNSTLPIVHLYVLPYNYQMLLPLINDLFHKFNLNPPNDWVYKFTNYVKTIPQYYCPFLRRALATTPNVPYQLVQYILPENLDSYLCPSVANYLKQMKNTAKQDQENLCLRVLKQLKQPKPAYHQLETVKIVAGQQLKRDIVTHPMLKDTFTKMHMEIGNYDSYSIVIPSIIQTAATKNYRNPYDIPRRDLIDEIARMRENFFRLPTSGISVYTKDSGHCLPISDMGNYQEYLKNKETPLRELEPTNVRQHMFGNPYKKDKNMVMVDEADLNDVALLKSGAPGQHQSSSVKKNMETNTVARLSRKRKAGPIRKDYVFKRLALNNSSTTCLNETGLTQGPKSDYDSTTDFGSDTDSESDSELLVITFDDTDQVPLTNSSSSQSLPKCLEKTVMLEETAVVHSGDAQQSFSQGSVKLEKYVSPAVANPSCLLAASSQIVTEEGSLTGEAVGRSYSQMVQQTKEPHSNTVHVKEIELLQPSHQPEQLEAESISSKLVEKHVQPRMQYKETLKFVQDHKTSDGKKQAQSDGSTIGDDMQLSESKTLLIRDSVDQSEMVESIPEESVESISGQVGVETKERGLIDAVTPYPLQLVEKPEKCEDLKLSEKQEGLDHARVELEEKVKVEPANEMEELEEKIISSDKPTKQEAKIDEVYCDHTKQLEHKLNDTESLKQPLFPIQYRHPWHSLDQADHAVLHGQLELRDQPVQAEQTLNRAMDACEQTSQDEPRQAQLVQSEPSSPQELSVPLDQQQHEEPAEIASNKPRTPVPSLEDPQPSEYTVPSLLSTASQSTQQHDYTFAVTQTPRLASQVHQAHSSALLSIVETSNMNDVLNISNIIKTCHNGDDTTSTTDRQLEEKPERKLSRELERRSPDLLLNDGPIAQENGGGAESIVGVNGYSPQQPSHNWSINSVLYGDSDEEHNLEQIEEQNLKTRSIIFRDIRRPGRDYSEMLKNLDLMQGNHLTRKKFVNMCVAEAKRFRRHRMAVCIQEWWDNYNVSVNMRSDKPLHRQASFLIFGAPQPLMESNSMYHNNLDGNYQNSLEDSLVSHD